jgi:transcriptional regulator with XRE-family HTH domain
MGKTATIGEKIASLRKSRGVTQADLGVYLNISYQAVSKWERDESCPDFATLCKIAKYFEVAISYFEDSETDEAETVEEEKVEETEKTAVVVETPPAKVMLGVCVECGRTVYEGEEGTLTPKLLCKNCYEEKLRKEKARQEAMKREAERKAEELRMQQLLRKAEIARGRNRGLIWSAVITGVLFILSLVSAIKDRSWADVGYTFLGALFIYTFVAQLFWDGAIVACATAGVSIATPGVIFELSLDGFIFLIAVKLLFALLRILFFLLTSAVCILVGILISPFTFVPALLRVNKGDLV